MKHETLKRNRFLIYALAIIILLNASCSRNEYSEITIKNFTFALPGSDFKLDTLNLEECANKSLYRDGYPFGSVFNKNCCRYINDSLFLDQNNDSVGYGKLAYSKQILNSSYILMVFSFNEYHNYYYSFYFIDTSIVENNECFHVEYFFDHNFIDSFLFDSSFIDRYDFDGNNFERTYKGYNSTNLLIQFSEAKAYSDAYLSYLIGIFSNPIKIDNATNCCCYPTTEIDSIILSKFRWNTEPLDTIL